MTSIQPEMESVDWPVPRWYQARQPQWIGDHQLSLLENGAEYFMAYKKRLPKPGKISGLRLIFFTMT